MTSINYVYVLYPISWLIGAILMACYFIKSKPLAIKSILYVIPMTSINYVYVLYPISWLIGAILMACYFIKSKPLAIKSTI